MLALGVVSGTKGKITTVDCHPVALSQHIPLPMKEHDHCLGPVTGLIRQAGADPSERHALGIDRDLDAGAVEIGERCIYALSFPSLAGASIVDLAVMEVVDVFGDPAVVDEVVLALLPLPLGEDDPDEPVRIVRRVDRHDLDRFVCRMAGEPHIPVMIEMNVVARQGYGGRERGRATAGGREGHAGEDQRCADQQPRKTMTRHCFNHSPVE